MRLRAALCALALLLQLNAPAPAALARERPAAPKNLNVLFLIADDLRPELGAYGQRGRADAEPRPPRRARTAAEMKRLLKQMP